MRNIVLLTTVLLLGLIHNREADADDARDIKQAIPADAAMMRSDFDGLATDKSSPSASKIEDKSLTLMLMAAKVKDDEKSKEQFCYLSDGYPSPKVLAKELSRQRRTGKRIIVTGPITFIHADSITDFTCKVNGDTATGNVSFKVPDLYQGKVDYVANKFGGQWFITEFIVPAYDIHLIRSDDGLWKEK